MRIKILLFYLFCFIKVFADESILGSNLSQFAYESLEYPNEYKILNSLQYIDFLGIQWTEIFVLVKEGLIVSVNYKWERNDTPIDINNDFINQVNKLLNELNNNGYNIEINEYDPNRTIIIARGKEDNFTIYIESCNIESHTGFLKPWVTKVLLISRNLK